MISSPFILMPKLFIYQFILRVANRMLSSEFLFEQLAAACMTWDLAESGKHFITTIINGSDLVPTFSAASVDDLRSEVRDMLCHYLMVMSHVSFQCITLYVVLIIN